jgi:PadR family transcriptional regulator, regulatory protein PadR
MSRRSWLGELELMVVLAVIRLGEDAYGVPIARELEAQGGRQVAFGSVYAALERLEEKGLVTSALAEPTQDRGGRAKRYFQATEKGIREVRETQRVLAGLWKGLPELKGGFA